MVKFPSDVRTAEYCTSGNVNIIEGPLFSPDTKSDFSFIFGKTDVKSTGNNFSFTYGNVAATSTPVTSDSLTRTTRSLSIPKYNMWYIQGSRNVIGNERTPTPDNDCFKCGNPHVSMNTLMRHMDDHVSGKLNESHPRPEKRKNAKVKPPALPFSSKISDENKDEPAAKKIKLETSCKKSPAEKKDLRRDLLEEWALESDNEDSSHNSTLETIKGSMPGVCASNFILNETTSHTTKSLSCSNLNDKSHQNARPSCSYVNDAPNQNARLNLNISHGLSSSFDFEEEPNEIIGTSSTGRKIPRVIPPPERMQLFTYDSSSEDDIEEKPKPQVSDSAVSEKSGDPDLDAFRTILNATTVPNVPEISDLTNTGQIRFGSLHTTPRVNDCDELSTSNKFNHPNVQDESISVPEQKPEFNTDETTVREGTPIESGFIGLSNETTVQVENTTEPPGVPCDSLLIAISESQCSLELQRNAYIDQLNESIRSIVSAYKIQQEAKLCSVVDEITPGIDIQAEQSDVDNKAPLVASDVPPESTVINGENLPEHTVELSNIGDQTSDVASESTVISCENTSEHRVESSSISDQISPDTNMQPQPNGVENKIHDGDSLSSVINAENKLEGRAGLSSVCNQVVYDIAINNKAPLVVSDVPAEFTVINGENLPEHRVELSSIGDQTNDVPPESTVISCENTSEHRVELSSISDQISPDTNMQPQPNGIENKIHGGDSLSSVINVENKLQGGTGLSSVCNQMIYDITIPPEPTTVENNATDGQFPLESLLVDDEAKFGHQSELFIDPNMETQEVLQKIELSDTGEQITPDIGVQCEPSAVGNNVISIDLPLESTVIYGENKLEHPTELSIESTMNTHEDHENIGLSNVGNQTNGSNILAEETVGQNNAIGSDTALLKPTVINKPQTDLYSETMNSPSSENNCVAPQIAEQSDTERLQPLHTVQSHGVNACLKLMVDKAINRAIVVIGSANRNTAVGDELRHPPTSPAETVDNHVVTLESDSDIEENSNESVMLVENTNESSCHVTSDGKNEEWQDIENREGKRLRQKRNVAGDKEKQNLLKNDDDTAMEARQKDQASDEPVENVSVTEVVDSSSSGSDCIKLDTPEDSDNEEITPLPKAHITKFSSAHTGEISDPILISDDDDSSSYYDDDDSDYDDDEDYGEEEDDDNDSDTENIPIVGELELSNKSCKSIETDEEVHSMSDKDPSLRDCHKNNQEPNISASEIVYNSDIVSNEVERSNNEKHSSAFPCILPKDGIINKFEVRDDCDKTLSYNGESIPEKPHDGPEKSIAAHQQSDYKTEYLPDIDASFSSDKSEICDLVLPSMLYENDQNEEIDYLEAENVQKSADKVEIPHLFKEETYAKHLSDVAFPHAIHQETEDTMIKKAVGEAHDLKLPSDTRCARDDTVFDYRDKFSDHQNISSADQLQFSLESTNDINISIDDEQLASKEMKPIVENPLIITEEFSKSISEPNHGLTASLQTVEASISDVVSGASEEGSSCSWKPAPNVTVDSENKSSLSKNSFASTEEKQPLVNKDEFCKSIATDDATGFMEDMLLVDDFINDNTMNANEDTSSHVDISIAGCAPVPLNTLVKDTTCRSDEEDSSLRMEISSAKTEVDYSFTTPETFAKENFDSSVPGASMDAKKKLALPRQFSSDEVDETKPINPKKRIVQTFQLHEQLKSSMHSFENDSINLSNINIVALNTVNNIDTQMSKFDSIQDVMIDIQKTKDTDCNETSMNSTPGKETNSRNPLDLEHPDTILNLVLPVTDSCSKIWTGFELDKHCLTEINAEKPVPPTNNDDIFDLCSTLSNVENTDENIDFGIQSTSTVGEFNSTIESSETPNEAQDLSGLSALADAAFKALPICEDNTQSELSETAIQNAESSNLTFLTDVLANSQIEIANTSASKQASSTNFSVDFAGSEDLLNNDLSKPMKDFPSKEEPDSIERSLGEVFAEEPNSEGTISNFANGNIIHQTPVAITMSANAKQLYETPEYSSSSKLLEILTDNKPKEETSVDITTPKTFNTSKLPSTHQGTKPRILCMPKLAAKEAEKLAPHIAKVKMLDRSNIRKAQSKYSHRTSRFLKGTHLTKIPTKAGISKASLEVPPRTAAAVLSKIARTSSWKADTLLVPKPGVQAPLKKSTTAHLGIIDVTSPCKTFSPSKPNMLSISKTDTDMEGTDGKRLTGINRTSTATVINQTASSSTIPRGKVNILRQTIVSPDGNCRTVKKETATVPEALSMDETDFDIITMPIEINGVVMTGNTETLAAPDVVQSSTSVSTPTLPAHVVKQPVKHFKLVSGKLALNSPRPALKTYSSHKSRDATNSPPKRSSITSSLSNKHVVVTTSSNQTNTGIIKKTLLTKPSSNVIPHSSNTRLPTEIVSEPAVGKLVVLNNTSKDGHSGIKLKTHHGSSVDCHGMVVAKKYNKSNVLQQKTPILKTISRSELSGILPIVTSASQSLPNITTSKSEIISASHGVFSKVNNTSLIATKPVGVYSSPSSTITKAAYASLPVNVSSNTSSSPTITKGPTARILRGVGTPTCAKKVKLEQDNPAVPRTILIKGIAGHLVKKVVGDAALEKQVQEQISAIKAKSSYSEMISKQESISKPKLPQKKVINRKITSAGKIITKPVPLYDESSTKLLKIKASGVNLSQVATLRSAQSRLPKPALVKVHTKQFAQKSETVPSLKNGVVLRDSAGNHTEIDKDQIVAVPNMGSEGAYVLLRLNEGGGLTPLNDEALLSLDPALADNVMLQVDNSAAATSTAIVESSTALQLSGVGVTDVPPQSAAESVCDLSSSESASNQSQLLLKYSDGKIFVQVENQLLFTEQTGSGDSLFQRKPVRNQDILAAALADTDVLQDTSMSSMDIHLPQLSPNGVLYSTSVANALKSPIMATHELPSSNTKIISDNGTNILSTDVPKNIPLPITITDPNIVQSVSQQHMLVASELGIPLSVREPRNLSTEISNSSFVYIPSFDDDNAQQQTFSSASISMPSLGEDCSMNEIVKITGNCSSSSKFRVNERDGIDADFSAMLNSSNQSEFGRLSPARAEPPSDMFDSSMFSDYQEMRTDMLPMYHSGVGITSIFESSSASSGHTSMIDSHPANINEDSYEIPVQPIIVTNLSSPYSSNSSFLLYPNDQPRDFSKRFKVDDDSDGDNNDDDESNDETPRKKPRYLS